MAGTSTAIGIGGLRRRKRKEVEARVAQRSMRSRDRSRVKLLQTRERYKMKVGKHERAMVEREKERPPSLNPLAISTMPSRETAKTFRRSQARWTALPSRPRYSRERKVWSAAPAGAPGSARPTAAPAG